MFSPRIVFVCMTCVAAGACANLNTIDRTTSNKVDAASTAGTARAIHLDAEQRVVMSHPNGIFCAEPSPDAVSATASSQGGGVSISGQGSGSLASAQQELIAALSRRTQSTQLQREVMFRICEAYYNNAITPLETARLLSRAQDLTAVVLAVEQLTGAVAADQFGLVNTASASSSAALVSTQNNLEVARTAEMDAKERLESEQNKLMKKETEIRTTQEDIEIVQGRLDTQNALPAAERDQSLINALQSEKNTNEASLARQNGEKNVIEGRIPSLQSAYDSARNVRETIEAELNSALTTATASTGGAIQFASNSQMRGPLSDAATQAVATAVTDMVNNVLGKTSIVETCLGILSLGSTNDNAINERNRLQVQAFSTCEQVLIEFTSQGSAALTR